MRLIPAFAILIGLGACASIGDRGVPAARPFSLNGEMIHACECDPYCPCAFSKDATYSQCRSLTVWIVDEGSEGVTELDGLTFVLSMTKVGKNVAESMGTWEGILLLPEQATPEQRKTFTSFVQRTYWQGFVKLEVRVEPAALERAEGYYELKMGKVVDLRVRALPGESGTTTLIQDPPSHLMGMGTLYGGVAEVHVYDDGAVRWDFAGRNAYYGPFEVNPGQAN